MLFEMSLVIVKCSLSGQETMRREEILNSSKIIGKFSK